MNKHVLFSIAIPLSISNVTVNIVFWSSHVDGIFADTVAGMWAVGLTLVEFLFPVWAILHNTRYKFLSFVFYVVGFITAVFSILVFAMTIDNTLSYHMETLEKNEQEKVHQKEKIQLQKEIAGIQLQAAQTAIDEANKYNEVDKISLGTMPAIKQADMLAEKIQRSLQESKEAPKSIPLSHPLKYLITLERLTGISKNTLKITIALILGLLVEVSAVLAVVALLLPNNKKDTQLKELPVNDTVIKPGEQQPSNIHSIDNSNESCVLKHTSEESNNSTDSSNDNKENELALLARVRRDILMGKYSDIPKLSTLPQKYPGTGLRYHHLQKLRKEMIACGEAVNHGKSRMKLKRIGDNNE